LLSLCSAKMEKPIFLKFLHTLTFLLLLPISSSLNPELEALMSFKTSSDTSNKLQTWNPITNPCTWSGITCLQNNRVSRLVLQGLNLTGNIQTLTCLTSLRILSLKNNLFSGPIPNLSNLTSLKLLFLSHNQFIGNFPMSLNTNLYRLDLSYNNISGHIPIYINSLTHLLTLRLEKNQFSGSLTLLSLPNLQDFNVSGNGLTGQIPKSLSFFTKTAFERNPVLCGEPLMSCKSLSTDPSKPGGPAIGSTPATVVSSQVANAGKSKTGKLSLLAVVGIIIGDVLILALVSVLLFLYFWRKMAGKSKSSREMEKIVYSTSPYRSRQITTQSSSGFERGDLVFFQGMKKFELEDLLRASAEMLGKGGFGTAYKAVLDGGNVVAVKRLKELQIGGKREVFDQHMEVLGKLRHENVVSLKAYYFAIDEKLLVYEFMPNGSLFWLLHGNRGPGRTPLDWTTRLKIAAGVAQGLAFIHHYSLQPSRLSHGNVKSSNVLIDSTGNARLTDFGLSMFASAAIMTRSNGYRAPEVSLDSKRFSHQKADVYAFGVLLLEILTGKCPIMSFENGGSGGVDLPRWVQSVVREEWTAEVFDLELMRYKDIEEEMVGLLQIGMSCTSVAPDQRPKISSVVKMIDELRGVDEASPSHESFDSMSESPSFSEDHRTG
ncbi:hypothetical protein IFM89_024354, partial [Coptis chinensis]